MKTHLRILWALLKKNNSHPSVYLAPILFALMALLAAWESGQPEADGTFIFGIIWLLILATASGTGAFSLDLKNDAIRFLEYLPIRKWHILAANFADGLFWLALFVLATSWARVVYWPGTSGPSPEVDAAALFLFHTRWSYPIGLFGLAFFAFSVAAYERIAIERDATAAVRANSSVILGIVFLIVLTAHIGVRPAIDEAALPLVLIGALNLLCAAVYFQFTRREWGRLRRWFQLRLPTMVVQITGSIAVVLLACSFWSKLDPNERARLSATAIPSSGTRKLLVEINARRSGKHLVLLDLADGTQRYLGRGLSYFRGEGDAITLDSPEPGFLPLTSGFVRLDSSGTIDWPSFLPDKSKEGGVSQMRGNVIWSQDGERVAFFARSDAGDSQKLVIADRNGQARYTARCAPYGSMLQLRRGTFLVTLANLTESKRDTELHSNYLIFDLEKDKQTEHQLPGELLFCDPDFTRALCLQTQRADDRPPERSLVLHHVIAGTTRQILSPEDLAPGEPGAEDESRWGSRLPSLASEGGGTTVGPLEVYVDRPMTQLTWHMARSPDRPASGVNLVHIETGERRQLVAADEVRRLRSIPNVLNLMGFTADGEGFRMRTATNLVRMSIDDGTRAILAHWDKTDQSNPYVHCTLSPNGDGVLVLQTEWNPGQSEAVQSWKVWERGLSTLLIVTPTAEVTWLDDGRILIADGSSLYVHEVTSGKRTLLYQAN